MVIACIISCSVLSREQIGFVAFDSDLMTFVMTLSQKLIFSCMCHLCLHLFFPDDYISLYFIQ